MARRIGKDIAFRNRTRLSRVSPKTSVRDLWDAVRKLSGRKRQQVEVDGVTARSLNQHYANISTDPSHQPPQCKLTVARHTGDEEVITEFRMFEILDKLQNTATVTGLDLLPAWFLRLGAPVFCGPLARLLNRSVATSTIPKQWKTATIMPVPKIARPRCVPTSDPFLSRQFSAECSSELSFVNLFIQHFSSRLLSSATRACERSVSGAENGAERAENGMSGSGAVSGC